MDWPCEGAELQTRGYWCGCLKEVQCENAGIQGVAVQSGKLETKVKKEDQNDVAMAASVATVMTDAFQKIES